jgi:hypothetical protein
MKVHLVAFAGLAIGLVKPVLAKSKTLSSHKYASRLKRHKRGDEAFNKNDAAANAVLFTQDVIGWGGRNEYRSASAAEKSGGVS